MLNSCESQSIQDCSSRHEIDSGTCKKKGDEYKPSLPGTHNSFMQAVCPQLQSDPHARIQTLSTRHGGPSQLKTNPPFPRTRKGQFGETPLAAELK
jgi:hypothetical protein